MFSIGESMTIIALSGKAGCGKDTFSDVLVGRYGFTKVSIADPLRNLCARVFHVDPTIFVDRDKKDADMQRIYLDFHDIDTIRYIVESEWGYEIKEDARNAMEEFHGTELNTPRDILRCVGNMLREAVYENIWIELAAAKIKESKGRIVITDCRFGNERDFFGKLGAILIRIKRNDNGETAEHEFNLGDDDEYDVIFTNDSTLHAYKSSIDMWFSTKEAEFAYYKVWKYDATTISANVSLTSEMLDEAGALAYNSFGNTYKGKL